MISVSLENEDSPAGPAEAGGAPPRARRVGEAAAGLGTDTEKVTASLDS